MQTPSKARFSRYSERHQGHKFTNNHTNQAFSTGVAARFGCLGESAVLHSPVHQFPQLYHPQPTHCTAAVAMSSPARSPWRAYQERKEPAYVTLNGHLNEERRCGHDERPPVDAHVYARLPHDGCLSHMLRARLQVMVRRQQRRARNPAFAIFRFLQISADLPMRRCAPNRSS